MKFMGGLCGRLRWAFVIVALAVMTGCVGYVDGDGGGAVVVAQPDVYVGGVWGGGWGGHDHDWGRRGAYSRRVAHGWHH